MAFRQIKSPALANQAVLNTKLDVSSVAGHSAAAGVGSLANDTLLMHSASENALKKLSVANLVGSLSTDNLAEGSNLYFTDARAQAAVAADIASAVLVEKTRAEGAESDLQDAIDAEVLRAEGAETTLTTNLANEVTRATGRENAIEAAYQSADANLQSQINNIISNVDPEALDSLAEIVSAYQAADDALTAGIQANASAISAETTRAQGAELALSNSIADTQSELDDTQSGAGLAADGSYVANTGANYIADATSLNSADVALDSAIKALDTAYKAADTTQGNAISALEGRMDTAEADIDTNAQDIADEVARATAAESANASAISDEIAARAIAVQGAKDYADTQDAAQYVTVTADIATATSNLEAYADQAEADAISSANAYTDARETAITTAYEAYADQAEVDAKAYTDAEITALDTSLSADITAEVNRATSAEEALGVRIDNVIANTDPAAIDSFTEVVAAFEAADNGLSGLISANQTAISTEATTRASADTTLQGNINSEAATRSAADTALQGNIDAEESARISADSALQTELDATQAGAGLAADGSYSANESANYIAAATSMVDADNKLDAAIKAMDTAYKAADATHTGAIAQNVSDIAQNAADIADNADAIAAEKSRAEGAEADLDARIDDVQSELDTTQTGAGLSADGSYVANSGANYIAGAVSLKDADTKLDAQVKANADAIATETQDRIDAVSAEAGLRTAADSALDTKIENEKTRALAAEAALSGRVTTNEGDIATLTAGLATEISARQNADSLIQTEVDAIELGAGLNESGAYVADETKTYIDDATSLFNADQQLDDAIVAEVARAEGAESDLQDAIDAEETRATTAEGVLQGNINTVASNLATEASTARAAEQANATAIANEVSRATGAESDLQDAIDAEELRATTAEGALDVRVTANEGDIASLQTFTGEGTVLDTTATDLAGAVNEIKAALGTSEGALAAEVDATQEGAGLGEDGAYTADATANYIDTATSLFNADQLLDAQLKATDARVDAILDGSSESLDQFVEVVTAFQNADSNLNDAISTLADNAGADRAAIRSEFAAADLVLQGQIDTNDSDIATLQSDLADEVTRATAAEGVNATAIATEKTRAEGEEARIEGKVDTNAANLAQEILDRAADVNAEETRATTAEGVLQDNIDAEATARDAADVVLQGNIDDVADDLATEVARATAAEGVNATAIATEKTRAEGEEARIEGKVDAEVTRATGEESRIEGKVDTNAANLAQEILDRVADVNAEETRATTAEGVLQGNIDDVASDLADEVTRATAAEVANANAISAEASARASADTSIRTDFAAADTSIRTDFAAADTAIQQELDATQTGAGLGTDGAYSANESANYISAATSLKDADNKLDAQAKANADAIAAEVTARTNAVSAEATARNDADVVLQGNIDAEATTRANADTALQNRATALETEMTATQSGAGLATNGDYVANGDANYIDTAVSLADADNKLDAAIKAENTRALAAEGVNASAIATETSRATAAEAGLSTAINGVASDLADEVTRATGVEAGLQSQIDSIISNTDPAALDSLTEIVTAFQDADSSLTGLVSANQTAIADEVTRATTAEGVLQDNINALETSLEAADVTLQANIDTKVSKAGDTMSGNLAMGGNKVTGLANGTEDNDAINKSQLDAAVSALTLDNFSTDDLEEGSNLYYTDARSRAAVSVVDVEGNGDFSYNSTTGVISADLSKSFLELTDVTETSFTGKGEYVAVVNAEETGMELVHASELQIFGQTYRQVIDGDGNQTTFALNFLADEASTLVFVGGVIQDPTSHYTVSDADQTITFTAALPLGTQAVIVARELVGASPFIADGSIQADKLDSTVAVGTRSGNTAVSTTGTVVDSFDASTYRSAKYLIQVDGGDGEFETREALVVHNGTVAYITEFAMVYTGDSLLGDASVQMNGTNVELVYTANAAGASVKVISTYIDA